MVCSDIYVIMDLNNDFGGERGEGGFPCIPEMCGKAESAKDT